MSDEDTDTSVSDVDSETVYNSKTVYNNKIIFNYLYPR